MRFVTGLFFALMTLVYASPSVGTGPTPAPSADPERGKQIATSVCAACHGADGNSPTSANPILAGQHAEYIAEQLAAFKSGARPSPIMQAMAAALSPEDMLNVGAYFQAQRTVPSIARDKALAQRGEQIWGGGIKDTKVPACASCHGAAGKGIPVGYPRLAGQYADLSFGWLKAYATGARPHPVMGAVAEKLTEREMKALAEFIAGLR